MSSKIVKFFIACTLLLSLGSILIDRLLPFLVSPYTITSLFSLSLWGVKHYFVWQFFTHLFLSPLSEGLSASYLIHLFLNLLVLWKVGSLFVYQKGLKHFLCLYLGSGIIAGITGLALLSLTDAPYLISGETPALFALLIAFLLLHPTVDVLFFLILPVKAKWIILGLIASILLIDLSNGAFLSLSTHIAALIYGYLYSVLVFQAANPFSLSFFKRGHHSLDQYIETRSKIYDFRTGNRVLSPTEFLTACQAKIAKEGKSSLSWGEWCKMRYLLAKTAIWTVRSPSNTPSS